MTTTSEASVFAGFGLPTEDQLTLDQRWQRWGNDLLEGLDGFFTDDPKLGREAVSRGR